MITPKKSYCFSTTIDLTLKNKLKHDLEEQGFSFAYPLHTIFSAKKKDISCTLYASGALTVQGKEKDEFIEFYLEPEILKNLSYSYPHQHINYESHIGVDEAGKGDFFGPLCVAALYADRPGIENLVSMGIKESKKISDKKALEYYRKIKKEYLYSLIILYPNKYNELYRKFHNLNHLLAWAHATAIQEAYQKSLCSSVLIDQFAHSSLVQNAVERKKTPIDLKQQHRGEEDIVVAGASLIARGAFLEGLDRLSNEIGIALPKGASSGVVETGKKIILKLGPDILEKISKTHFKTKEDICSS